MSCNPTTLLAEAAANGIAQLEERSLMLAICGFLSTALGGETASQAMARGVAYQAYSDQQLDDAIDAHLCALLP